MCGHAAMDLSEGHESNTIAYVLPDKTIPRKEVSEHSILPVPQGLPDAEHVPPESFSENDILPLYDEYRPRLYRYMRSMQLGPEEAEEIVQETFMRLTIEFRKGGELENVRGWIVRVAHNLAVNLLKKENGRIVDADSRPAEMRNLVDPSSGPEETYSKQERSRLMHLTLSGIKPQHRQCFQMRAQGLTYKEIGLAMGISGQRAALLVKQVGVRLAATCGCENVR
jgi:RNA polymerase sigma-70 factor (ECF subfamily)